MEQPDRVLMLCDDGELSALAQRNLKHSSLEPLTAEKCFKQFGDEIGTEMRESRVETGLIDDDGVERCLNIVAEEIEDYRCNKQLYTTFSSQASQELERLQSVLGADHPSVLTGLRLTDSPRLVSASVKAETSDIVVLTFTAEGVHGQHGWSSQREYPLAIRKKLEEAFGNIFSFGTGDDVHEHYFVGWAGKVDGVAEFSATLGEDGRFEPQHLMGIDYTFTASKLVPAPQLWWF